MADAARWINAAEPALGLEPETILCSIIDAQTITTIERVENDPVVIEILNAIRMGPIKDTMGAIHSALLLSGSRHDRFFPRTPAHLSRHLKRMKPAMEKAGIFVEIGDHSRIGTTVRLWLTDQIGQEFKSCLIRADF